MNESAFWVTLWVWIMSQRLISFREFTTEIWGLHGWDRPWTVGATLRFFYLPNSLGCSWFFSDLITLMYSMPLITLCPHIFFSLNFVTLVLFPCVSATKKLTRPWWSFSTWYTSLSLFSRGDGGCHLIWAVSELEVVKRDSPAPLSFQCVINLNI